MADNLRTVPAELGAHLRGLRQGRGLSLKEVEAKTGVNHGQQSRIERGDFKRCGSNVQKLCNFYGVNPCAPSELAALRARLEQAVQRVPVRRALEAFLDAVDSTGSQTDHAGRQ
jgi:transcriptional regulator with XRE-family HTH domain